MNSDISHPLDVHGRQFNSRNQNYVLPADNPEYERLNLQHRAVKLSLGGLFPCPELVQKVLAPQEGVDKSAIDVGSGSGIWAVELAQEHPSVKVIGFDLAPSSHATPPPNCEFVTGDVRNGLSQYRNTFSLVHSRSLGYGLLPSGYTPYVKTAVESLVAGGIIIIGDQSLVAYDENLNPYPTDLEPGQPKYSYLAHLFAKISDLSKHPPELKNAAKILPEYLAASNYLENIDSRTVYIPLNWAGPDGSQAEVGNMMRVNLKNLIHAYKPLLVSNGYDDAIAEEWIRKVEAEVDGDEFKFMTKWPFTWATKIV